MRRLLLLLSLLLPMSALAQSGSEWLSRMSEALRTTDYEGTLIYMDGGRMEMMRIFHSAAEDRERVVTLSGPHREVIREGRSVTCIGLGRPATIYDGLGLSALAPVATALEGGNSASYRVEVMGADRAAGRAAQRIEVRSTDGYRYGYRLWLDESTAFPLRMALLDSAGRVLEDLAFTDITLGRKPAESSLEPKSQQALRRITLPAPVEQGQTDAERPTIPGLPEGFAVMSHEQSDDAEEHWVFSDGLASVSVYVKPASSLDVAERETRAGSVHGKLIQHSGRRVYAMGKVPAETVDLLARRLVDQPLADSGG
ncbi:MAG: MucB/RseB C-terminal domain-containing protein [Xanthomonadaceae bacterium]|nr:MucB/RseB C-terminal domain-containing protein [Xanthomonadaceae bacterium]